MDPEDPDNDPKHSQNLIISSFYQFFLLPFLTYPKNIIKIHPKTRPTYRRSKANLYPPERQLTKASEPSFDLGGWAQGQIRPHQKIPRP